MAKQKIFKDKKFVNNMKKESCICLGNSFESKLVREHSGEWIAIDNQEVIASGNSLKRVLAKARKMIESPLVLRVPPKKEVLLA